MPTPPPRRAVRALPRPSLRRIRHLLALTAVALPLVASVAASAGAPAPGQLADASRSGADAAVADRPAVPARTQAPARTRAPQATVDLPRRIGGEVDALVRSATSSPQPRSERLVGGQRPGDTVWDVLARCESSGRWDAERIIDGEVVYRGGLQFADSTWWSFRPDGFPDLASHATREQQIVVAERVLAVQGWAAWPACSRRLGLR